MAKTPLGNISRNDVVVFKDETDSDAPVDLDDINAATPGASKILAITSGGTDLEWISQTGSATALASLSDTDITTPADGAVLIYDTGTATWRDFVLNGDITMNNTGGAFISVGVVNVQHLAAGPQELGTRLIGVTPVAAPGAEAANEIEVSYGLVNLVGDAINFSSGWIGTSPVCRFIISSTVNGPKKHSTAFVSAVTQGVVVDGLNTADILILATEPATGTHIKFKVKLATAGSVYIFAGGPPTSYWSVYQYELAPQTITFA